MTVRSPAFWSHAVVSQSAASAAGWVPPMTNPKNRPDGIAVSPGSHASASRSMTSTGSVGPSGRSRPSRSTSSATGVRGGTSRSARLASQVRAWAWARSSAAAAIASSAIRSSSYPRGVPVERCTEPVDASLPPEVWRPLAEAHATRLAPYVEPHLARRRAGEQHPVHDFLFTYYSQRPAQLLRWHPGFGVRLADAAAYDGLKGYEVSTARPPWGHTCLRRVAATAARGDPAAAHGDRRTTGAHRLLRAARVGDGLPGQTRRRHPQPLRLGGAGTDTVVESHRIACSHFDAFRFFTDDARPRNTLRPGPDDRPAFEQPGCLHAGMDLYKHAFRLTPMVCSDLVADCFELAWDIRELDMRAAPYDLSEFEVVPRSGSRPPRASRSTPPRSESSRERGAPLRARLTEECERLLAVS